MCPIRSSAVDGEPREQTGNGRSAAGAARDASSTIPARPRPLVVVSNRLPFAIAPRTEGARVTRAPGGLVSALEPALAERGGLWIGWDGLARDARHPVDVTPQQLLGAREKMLGVRRDLESHQVRGQHAAHQLARPRQYAEHVGCGEGDMQEEPDDVVARQAA